MYRCSLTNSSLSSYLCFNSWGSSTRMSLKLLNVNVTMHRLTCKFNVISTVVRHARFHSQVLKITNRVCSVCRHVTTTRPIRPIQGRFFHVTNSKAADSLLWFVLLKPVSIIAAGYSGRRARRWYFSLGHTERERVLETFIEYWQFSLAFLVSVAFIYLIINLQPVPITGRTAFVSYTLQDSYDIGEFQAEIMYFVFKENIYPKNSPLALKVEKIVRDLISANQELSSRQNWQVFVVNSNIRNACVYPSGQIFFFDGLLPMLENDNQMAMVLGHEMAHVVLNHGCEILSLQSFTDNIFMLCMFVVWFLIPRNTLAIALSWVCSNVLGLFYFPLSRTHEREADKVGMMFASKACYDYREGAVFWKKYALWERAAEMIPIPPWFRSHPQSTERADNLSKLEKDAKDWRGHNPLCQDINTKK
ncbi:metalloendopeptidase [Bulinus truncatus]|nr:metalloendopeptidase [Bulinus truncatus]